MKDVLTLPEVAKYLRVSVHHVRFLIRDGELIAFSTSKSKERRHWRVKKETLDKFVSENLSRK